MQQSKAQQSLAASDIQQALLWLMADGQKPSWLEQQVTCAQHVQCTQCTSAIWLLCCARRGCHAEPLTATASFISSVFVQCVLLRQLSHSQVTQIYCAVGGETMPPHDACDAAETSCPNYHNADATRLGSGHTR